MVEPFKNLLHAGVVRDIATLLQHASPTFDHARFESLALHHLDRLEMKARALQITAALEATLPDDFEEAAAQLEAAMDHGLTGWALWPVGEFVARRGLAMPQRALAVLHTMTQRFSAEFAIRPFIVANPDLAFATLARWARDPSPAVRRLVSEGSRPRLPWGLRLKPLIADPSPTLPLLEALLDDADESVRRSVANHLNDIAKDHPALLADWVERHLPDAPPARRALLRHACRSLVKQGDPRILAAWGFGRRLRGDVRLRVMPRRIALGEALTLDVVLHASGRGRQRLVVDYAIHHVKANGKTSPKIFKGWTLELAGGERRDLHKRHAIKPITTRRYFSGRHRVELLVNGAVVAEAAFELTA